MIKIVKKIIEWSVPSEIIIRVRKTSGKTKAKIYITKMSHGSEGSM